MTYKMIQVTNLPTAPFGAVAIGGVIPLGVVTHKVGGCNCNQPTFTVTTSGANTVSINNTGLYRVTFDASVVATAAGDVTLNLVQNGTVIASATQTAVAGETVNLSLTRIIAAYNTFGGVVPTIPANIQITNTGTTALTSGTSNLIVERIY